MISMKLFILCMVLLLFGCSRCEELVCPDGTAMKGDPENSCQTGDCPDITWDLAVKTINNGEVEQLTQTHNLEVTLVLKNGLTVRTTEPKIDDVFDVVRKCKKCLGMVMATE